MIQYLVLFSTLFSSVLMANGLFAEVMVSGNDLAAMTGTNQVKIVFENNGLLYLVDFTNSTDQKPAIIALPQTQGAIVPHFSPDGAWIVYGKGPNNDMNNNESLKSSAYVTAPDPLANSLLVTADSAHEPRFALHQMPPNIVYSTVGKWNAWNGAGEVRTKVWDQGTLLPEVTLTTQGSFYGGFDGQYLATSSQFGVVYDVSNPNARPDTVISYSLYKASTNEWNESPRQICNVSLSPSTEYKGAILGLDFGTAGRVNDSINNGTPWGLHDLLLLAGADGTLLKTFLRPNTIDLPDIVTDDDSYNEGKQHWDDPEWTNHPHFAIANLEVSRSFLNEHTQNWDNTSNHERIFMVHLKDSSYLEIIRSTNVSQQSTTNMQWPIAHIAIPSTGMIERPNWLTESQSTIFSHKTPKTLGNNHLSITGGILHLNKDWKQIDILDLSGKLITRQRVGTQNTIHLGTILHSGNIFLFKITKVDHSEFTALMLF